MSYGQYDWLAQKHGSYTRIVVGRMVQSLYRILNMVLVPRILTVAHVCFTDNSWIKSFW